MKRRKCRAISSLTCPRSAINIKEALIGEQLKELKKNTNTKSFVAELNYKNQRRRNRK